MLDTGLMNFAGVDPQEMKKKFIDELKGLTEEAVGYKDKYDD